MEEVRKFERHLLEGKCCAEGVRGICLQGGVPLEYDSSVEASSLKRTVALPVCHSMRLANFQQQQCNRHCGSQQVSKLRNVILGSTRNLTASGSAQ